LTCRAIGGVPARRQGRVNVIYRRTVGISVGSIRQMSTPPSAIDAIDAPRGPPYGPAPSPMMIALVQVFDHNRSID